MLEVRETNLAAQLFFRSLSFRAVNVLHDFYDDTTEDAYVMQYRHRAVDALDGAADTHRVLRRRLRATTPGTSPPTSASGSW